MQYAINNKVTWDKIKNKFVVDQLVRTYSLNLVEGSHTTCDLVRSFYQIQLACSAQLIYHLHVLGLGSVKLHVFFALIYYNYDSLATSPFKQW